MAADSSRGDVMAPINNASPEVQTIIKEVLRLEHEHLWAERPRLNEDVVLIVKRAVADTVEGEQ